MNYIDLGWKLSTFSSKKRECYTRWLKSIKDNAAILYLLIEIKVGIFYFKLIFCNFFSLYFFL